MFFVVDRRIDNLAVFVLGGMEKFVEMNETRKAKECGSEGFCYRGKILDDIDKQLSYTK